MHNFRQFSHKCENLLKIYLKNLFVNKPKRFQKKKKIVRGNPVRYFEFEKR